MLGVTYAAAAATMTFGTSGTAAINGTFQTTDANGFSGATTTSIVSTNAPTITLGSASTVNYNGTGAQFVNGINYANLTISSARTGANNVTLDPSNTIGVSAAFTASATFGTGGYIITGSTINFNNATGGQTVTAFNYNNLTVSNTSGATTLAGSGTVGIAGAFTPGSGAYTVAGSTVNFNGTGAQTVNAFSFNNLTISGARTTNSVTLASGTTGVAGAFANSASYSTGALVTTGNTVSLNGAAAQTITGATVFNNLTIANTSGGVSLSSPETVAGTFTLTSGILTTTATNILSVTNNATTAIAGGSTTSFINGPVSWTLPASLGTGSTYVFPVGATATYLPFTLNSPTTGATAPVITVQAFAASAGGTADGTTLATLSTTEYWSASFTGSYTGGNISLTRQAALGSLSAIGQSSTKTGTYASIGGTASGTSINNSNNITALGFFVMAKPLAQYYYGSSITTDVTSVSAWWTTADGTGLGTGGSHPSAMSATYCCLQHREHFDSAYHVDNAHAWRQFVFLE